MNKIILVLAVILTATQAMATTIGVSTHPFTMKKQVITTEYDTYTSVGKGAGISAKYYRQINDEVNMDAGFTITNGDRANRVFAGADYLLVPDYGRQPRISIKGLIESADFDGQRINGVGVAPTLSKGFSFWGKEAFPFVALPWKLNLNADDNAYESSTALALGITGRLPFDGYENLIGNFETNVNIRNSYTAIVLGISLPIQ